MSSMEPTEGNFSPKAKKTYVNKKHKKTFKVASKELLEAKKFAKGQKGRA